MPIRIMNIVFGCSMLATLLFSSCASSCSAQTEEQALENLRSLTRDGQLPPENVVADLERRFAGKRTGALARLVHARIRFEGGDYAVAASLLETDLFRTKTKVADEALWLRARALEKAGNNADATKVAEGLIHDFPQSIRVRDAKLVWARAALAAGRAIDVPPFLVEMSEANDPDALILTARAYQAQNSMPDAIRYYRRTYFFAAGTTAAQEAEAMLTSLAQPLTPQSPEEQIARADQFAKAKNYGEAARALDTLFSAFPTAVTSDVQLRRVTAYANAGRLSDAAADLKTIPSSAKEREQAYRELALSYAKTKQWERARSTVDQMRQQFPNGSLVAKTLIDVGLAARDAKDNADASYFFNTAVAAYPNAVEVAQAQFESAWQQHESKNFAISSQMFVDHLAKYADKDTSNRGKAGYWSARDSERAGNSAAACALYEGVTYRYGSNWYGYLAAQRIGAMRAAGQCQTTAAPNATIAKAVANLRTVTVAAETAGAREVEVVAKADELSTIGLFDWAIDELNDAKRTAANSPSVNLALARYYRIRKWKNDNTNAFVALAKSYPDYAQMFPEEMGREEWSIFYPLSNWSEIKYWSDQRKLDPYQVAGLIRQESVFDPKAKSPANAYGLMQLIIPTAQVTARKYGSNVSGSISVDTLLQPPVSIELGTAYLRDMLDKFGRIEYVAV
ncbi:MAG: transglycosylase SLT domain-containing protein, partial [Acidobacteria bacterium]|nr:transglycosylase SLT domain-containing protein [Acidobacteriota bacterium]